MSDADLKEKVLSTANLWLEGNFDKETKSEVKRLMQEDESELIECFYRSLEFGTGGLRGIMGVGTNRMNIYTVGMATQGLCNYLKKNFHDQEEIKVAIAYDSRNNSQLFAETTAKIFAGNDIKAYLFDSLRPTPELSFAIRHMGCQSGVVITASHNPKEYNGYKVYWEDGGQIISPHDKNIIAEVEKIKTVDEIKNAKTNDLIQMIGQDIDKAYLNAIKQLSLSPEIIEKQNDLKIVYTPIHGTGTKLVPDCLQQFGFKNIIKVPEQDKPDGNFPTVISPNPEESSALKMALEQAQKKNADIVMATDPDADRVGIAVKDNKGKFILLNGNQIASVLINYLLIKWNEKNKLKGKEYIVKTIVTSDLLSDIASKYNVPCYNVLTGFKYIADIIKTKELKYKFIGGGEESYGYLAGEFVRDKDAVMSCALIAEATAWAKDQGLTLFDILLGIYEEHGFYKEELLSLVREGKSGNEEIKKMMQGYRHNPPASINGSRIVKIADYKTSEYIFPSGGERGIIDLPASDVLQFFLEDGSKISVRPSGTEPKIKFYFSTKIVNKDGADYETINKQLAQKLDAFKKDLKLI